MLHRSMILPGAQRPRRRQQALLAGLGLLVGLATSGGASAQSQQCVSSALAGGSGDAITIPLQPCALATNLLVLTLAGANTTTTPTLQMVGFAAQPVTGPNGAALLVGALPGAGYTVLLTSTGLSWKLLEVVAAGQLPTPSLTTLGGVFAINSVANEWVNSISLAGAPQLSQPGFGNLSGSASCGQLPALTGNVTTSGCAATIPAGTVTNAMRAQMPAAGLKGNLLVGAGNEADLTPPQVQTLLGSGQIIFVASGINFNSGNTDTQIPVTLPSWASNYIFSSIRLSGASGSLTGATMGVFTAAAAGGTAVVASGTAITVSTGGVNSANNAQNFTITIAGATEAVNFPNLFVRVQTPEGSPATGTVVVILNPVS